MSTPRSESSRPVSLLAMLSNSTRFNSAHRWMAGGSTLAAGRLAVACAFVAQLPFEVRSPLARIGPIQITNLELTGYVLILLWLASIIWGDLTVSRPSRMGVAIGITLIGGLLVTSVSYTHLRAHETRH